MPLRPDVITVIQLIGIWDMTLASLRADSRLI